MSLVEFGWNVPAVNFRKGFFVINVLSSMILGGGGRVCISLTTYTYAWVRKRGINFELCYTTFTYATYIKTRSSMEDSWIGITFVVAW